MRKLKKFLAELLIACMVFTSVPFTSLASGPRLFDVLPKVDKTKGNISVATVSAASGSTVSYITKAAYGYKHQRTDVEVYGASPSEVITTVTDEKYDPETGQTSGEFTMPGKDVWIHPYFVKDGKDRYKINFVKEAGTHYNCKVSNIIDEYEEAAPAGSVEAAEDDEVTIYATSSNLDYKVVDVDIVGKESSITVEYKQDGGFYTFTMPDEEVLIYVTEEYKEPAEYAITVETVENGRIYVESSAVSGETVTFICKPNNGYALNEEYVSVKIVNEDRTPIEVHNVLDGIFEFTMPNADVVINAVFDKMPNLYEIKDLSTTNCKVYFTKTYAGEGDAIYMDVFPDEDHYIKSVVVSGDTSLQRIDCFAEYVDESYAEYKFIMPEENVNVRVICEANAHTVTDGTSPLNKTRGTVTITPNRTASFNETVKIACEPKDGYKVESVKVNVNGGEIPVSQPVIGVDNYTFTMPDKDVTVVVCFALTGKTFDVSFVDYGQTFVDSYSIVGDSVVVIDGVAEALPETELTAKLVLKPGCELDRMVVSGIEDNGQYDFDDAHNRTWTIKFEMPNNDVTFDGDYSTFQWNVSARVDDESPSDKKGEATITADLGKDLSGNYIAHYGDTVVLHADYDVDDTAEILVKDINGKTVPASADEAKKTWTFTMPNSKADVVEKVSPVVHTINADMSQSNGTYQVCYEGGAPASAGVRGTQIYIVTSPDEGYEVATVTVAKGSGADIQYSVPEENKYYAFTVPDDFTDVEDTIEIAVTFQETIAKICQDAIDALVDPAAALNTISGKAAGVLNKVNKAEAEAHTQTKKDALNAVGKALTAAKNNVDGMAAVIADLKADSEELRDKTEKTAEDRTAAEGYRNAARIYAGSYTVLVDACNLAITGTEAPLAIVERSVTFNTNGGSEVASQWVVNNSKASKPNAPTKQGYYFVNWYSDASLTNAYDFEMPVDRDITIFAKWNANSSGGSGGSGGSGAPVKAKAPTYSANWYVDAAGTWRIKNSAGQIVASAWLCDDAVAANGQNVWYLLDTDGSMIAAGLVQDATGHFYSIETNHNGYYGMLRYQDGYYDCNGRQVYLQFSRAHDGSFGAIINAEGLAALREIYGVKQFGINNSNCVYTKTF